MHYEVSVTVTNPDEFFHCCFFPHANANKMRITIATDIIIIIIIY